MHIVAFADSGASVTSERSRESILDGNDPGRKMTTRRRRTEDAREGEADGDEAERKRKMMIG